MLRQLTGPRQPFIATATRTAHQPVKLLGVGSEDDAAGQLLEPCLMVGEDIECVGVQHHRTLRAPHLTDDGNGGVLVAAEPRSDAYGVEVIAVDTF